MIKNVKNTWTFPDDGLVKIQTTTSTDAEGTIVVKSDNIGPEITTITPEIYNVTKNDIENNKYVKTGANIYDSAFFTTSSTTCEDTAKIDWVLKSRAIPGLGDGKYYLIKLDLDSKIKIDFIVILRNIEE